MGATQAIGIIEVDLTRDFKETIQARVARDPAFREALLKEGGGLVLPDLFWKGRRDNHYPSWWRHQEASAEGH